MSPTTRAPVVRVGATSAPAPAVPVAPRRTGPARISAGALAGRGSTGSARSRLAVRALIDSASHVLATRAPTVVIDMRRKRDHSPSSGSTSGAYADRVLASILFTDIVGSTQQLAKLGDAGWRRRLDRHHNIIAEGLGRFRGHFVKNTGDGMVATFDGPARSVGAARWILDALAAEGLNARAGVHVGEIQRHGDDIFGLAVHVAAHVMGQAGRDEVLVSRTVRDLTAGSGLNFEDRGHHTLKGLPDDWQLYAVA